MGDKDRPGKLFVACRDVFAELVNVLVFQGEKVLAEERILPGPTESIYQGKNAELTSQFQDYSMYEVVQGEVHALYTVENQDRVDRRMVLRHAGYEGAAYRRQYKGRKPEGQSLTGQLLEGQIREGQTQEGQIREGQTQEEQFPESRIQEGRFSESRIQEGQIPTGQPPEEYDLAEGKGIYPVISLVLNWGEKRWTAATTIPDLLDYPVHRGAEDYLDRNRMHVFDMRFLDREQRGLFEGDMRVVLDYLSDRESLLARRQKLRNPEEVMRMLHALSGDIRYLENITRMKEEGGSAVCDLLDEMVNRGIEIGKQEGLEEGMQKGMQKGIQEGIQKGVQEGIKALISSCKEFEISFDQTVAKVKEKYCLGEEEAVNNMRLYW